MIYSQKVCFYFAFAYLKSVYYFVHQEDKN